MDIPRELIPSLLVVLVVFGAILSLPVLFLPINDFARRNGRTRKIVVLIFGLLVFVLTWLLLARTVTYVENVFCHITPIDAEQIKQCDVFYSKNYMQLLFSESYLRLAVWGLVSAPVTMALAWLFTGIRKPDGIKQ